ncbi:MAG: PspA/IM30 family protein [Myxococcota bacterium]
MSFLQRIQRSLRADAHGLVDALEDESLLLKQCLRDAELEVQRKRERLLKLEADWKRFSVERERAQKEVDRAERDAELAIAQNREDLARYALKQVLNQRNLVERIGARMHECAEEQKELSGTLATQQVALEELRARVQAFLCDRESGRIESTLVPVSEEQVELELMRRKAAATKEPSHG